MEYFFTAVGPFLEYRNNTVIQAKIWNGTIKGGAFKVLKNICLIQSETFTNTNVTIGIYTAKTNRRIGLILCIWVWAKNTNILKGGLQLSKKPFMWSGWWHFAPLKGPRAPKTEYYLIINISTIFSTLEVSAKAARHHHHHRTTDTELQETIFLNLASKIRAKAASSLTSSWSLQ